MSSTTTTDVTSDHPRQHREVVSLLVTGWTCVALAALFRDVHELFRAGVIDQMRVGVVNGNPVTDGLLLAGGVGVLVIVAMPLVLRAAPWRVARRVVVGAAPLTALLIVANGVHDPDDVLFAAAQIGVLAWLAVVAHRHRPDPRRRSPLR